MIDHRSYLSHGRDERFGDQYPLHRPNRPQIIDPKLSPVNRRQLIDSSPMVRTARRVLMACALVSCSRAKAPMALQAVRSGAAPASSVARSSPTPSATTPLGSTQRTAFPTAPGATWAPLIYLHSKQPTGEAGYQLDAAAPLASAGARSRFAWLSPGYIEFHQSGEKLAVDSWEPFATAPTASFSLRGSLNFYGSGFAVSDVSARVAMLVLAPGSLHTADLYVWSRSEGLRKLRSTTAKQAIMSTIVEWSSDGQWLMVEGAAKDCRATSPFSVDVEIERCPRLLLLNASSGEIAYRTPAAVAPTGVVPTPGHFFIEAEPGSSVSDENKAGLGGIDARTSWFDLDIAKLELTKSSAPSFSSPDGRFRVSDENQTTSGFRVATADGTASYRVDGQPLDKTPVWRGGHLLQLWIGAFDLETQELRQLGPEGCQSAAACSPDGQSALLYCQAPGGPIELRWARAR